MRSNAYAIKIYRSGRKPVWGYYITETLKKARDYALDVDAEKVEIYVGSSGVSNELYTKVVEVHYPKKERKMASEKETVAEVLAEFGKNIELMRKCKCVGVSLWNCLKFRLRIEAAHNREVAELRECLRIIRDHLILHTIKSADGKYVNNGAFLSEEFVDDERWRRALEGANDEGK